MFLRNGKLSLTCGIPLYFIKKEEVGNNSQRHFWSCGTGVFLSSAACIRIRYLLPCTNEEQLGKIHPVCTRCTQDALCSPLAWKEIRPKSLCAECSLFETYSVLRGHFRKATWKCVFFKKEMLPVANFDTKVPIIYILYDNALGKFSSQCLWQARPSCTSKAVLTQQWPGRVRIGRKQQWAPA